MAEPLMGMWAQRPVGWTLERWSGMVARLAGVGPASEWPVSTAEVANRD